MEIFTSLCTASERHWGGNDVHIVAFGSSQCGRYACNLHYEWDTGLLEHVGRSEAEYVAYLEQFIQQKHLKASGDQVDWANEPHDLARAAWLSDGGSADDKYYAKEITVIDDVLR